MAPTFRERYCQHWAIPPSRFEEHLFARTLYPHARVLHIFLRLMPGYFIPDLEFLHGMGDLRSRRFFNEEACEFHATEANHNRNFLRHLFRLRVSADRVLHCMDECWGDIGESQSPIGPPGS